MDEKQQSLIQTILDQGNELANTPANQIPEATPLRAIQECVDENLFSFEDSDWKFLAYFLHVFLDDFFFNLTGDIPYVEEADKARGDTLRGFGKLLVRITQTLREKNSGELYKAYVDLVDIYLAGLDEYYRIVNDEILHQEKRPS